MCIHHLDIHRACGHAQIRPQEYLDLLISEEEQTMISDCARKDWPTTCILTVRVANMCHVCSVSHIVMCTGIDLQVLVQAHTFSCLLRLGSRPPDDEWVSDKNEDLGMLCSIPT